MKTKYKYKASQGVGVGMVIPTILSFPPAVVVLDITFEPGPWSLVGYAQENNRNITIEDLPETSIEIASNEKE